MVRWLEATYGEAGAGAVLMLMCVGMVLMSLHWLCSRLDFESIPGQEKPGLFVGWGRDVSRRMFFMHFWVGYGLLVVALICLTIALV